MLYGQDLRQGRKAKALKQQLFLFWYFGRGDAHAKGLRVVYKASKTLEVQQHRRCKEWTESEVYQVVVTTRFTFLIITKAHSVQSKDKLPVIFNNMTLL